MENMSLYLSSISSFVTFFYPYCLRLWLTQKKTEQKLKMSNARKENTRNRLAVSPAADLADDLMWCVQRRVCCSPLFLLSVHRPHDRFSHPHIHCQRAWHRWLVNCQKNKWKRAMKDSIYLKVFWGPDSSVSRANGSDPAQRAAWRRSGKGITSGWIMISSPQWVLSQAYWSPQSVAVCSIKFQTKYHCINPERWLMQQPAQMPGKQLWHHHHPQQVGRGRRRGRARVQWEWREWTLGCFRTSFFVLQQTWEA